MDKIILLLLIFISITVTYADSATQTDWSGGSGVWGPVTEFGMGFYSDSGIACYFASGDIAVGMIDNVVIHYVDEHFNAARSVYTEDIDGDGDMDILAAAYGDGISWWENVSGLGIEWTEHIIDDIFYHPYSICSKDIDGDGDMDAIGCSPSSSGDGICWWENVDGTGTAWTKHIVDVYFAPAYDVHSEDIDGDGDMDVICVSYTGIVGGIFSWENVDGTGTIWIKHTVCCPISAGYVYSADIDGDGDKDVLSFHGHQAAWWENVIGSGTLWLEHITDAYFDTPAYVYSEDIDGDGDMDIVVADDGDSLVGDICWLENADGTGTSWVRHNVHGYFFYGASSVHSADMDNDGDMDILGTAYYEGDVDWFENLNGSGTSWARHPALGVFPWVYTVYSADIDGDGIKDVISASSNWDDVAWLDVLTYPPEASLISSVLDTECSPVWSDIDWSASEPAGTSVGFQVRSSSDPDSTAMGSWSDTLYSPCSLSGILTDGEQYVQYRAVLETSDPDVTPVLHEVTLTWTPLGIQGEPEPESFELLPFHPNPATASPVIRFTLPETSSVELFVFDITGRLIETTPPQEYSSGYHSIFLDELSPGIYFCRMVSGEFTATQRLVVID